MNNELIVEERVEEAVLDTFLDSPNEDSFTKLFKTFNPQLIAFFRARACGIDLAEDLAQDVMLAVYRNASRIRDRKLFRGWLFTVARNARWRNYRNQNRETVNLEDVAHRLAAVEITAAGSSGFEFLRWMAFLDSREREVMKLRFLEQWEYHEIATAAAIPIGTVQWRVFNAKKKLAPHLAAREDMGRITGMKPIA